MYYLLVLIFSTSLVLAQPLASEVNYDTDEAIDSLRVTILSRSSVSDLDPELKEGVHRSVRASIDALIARTKDPQGGTEPHCEVQTPQPNSWIVTCEICYPEEGICCGCTVSSSPGPNNPCGCGDI